MKQGLFGGIGEKESLHLPSAYIVPGTRLGALHGFSFNLQEPPVKKVSLAPFRRGGN